MKRKYCSLIGFASIGAMFMLTGYLSVHAAPIISHGPLAQKVRAHDAKVWLRTSEPAKVLIEYSTSSDFPSTNTKGTAEFNTHAGRDYTAQIMLRQLRPLSYVYYRIYLNGVLQSTTYGFRTAPLTGQTTDFTFAVLTDFTGKNSAPVLAEVAEKNPDFLIILGDLDHRNPQTLVDMRQMHKNLRSAATKFGADFKRYVIDRYPLRQFAFYHVWDDHDFGRNNASKFFPGKKDALQAFREYYVLASRETESGEVLDGIWQIHQYAHADMFLLDLRSQRDRDSMPDGPNKSMLGPKQKYWFKEALSSSSARWKFIFSTVPFNPGTKPFDAWGAYLNERKELVNFIHNNTITGVMFISGDIHSGGAIDDGTNCDFPEVSVPHANLSMNFSDTTRGYTGLWSEGYLSGKIGPGFAFFEVSSDNVIITIYGVQGETRMVYFFS